MSVRARFGVAGALILLLAVGCGRDDGAQVRTIDEGGGSASAPGSGSGASGSASGAEAGLDPATADTTVNVVLREWTITPQPAEVQAGVIAFDVTNEGGTLHEVVVLRAPSAESLPVAADGTADEAQLGEQNSIGEVEVPVGETKAVAFELQPGSYVLICNIVDEDGHVHFKEGMHTPLTVT